LAELRKLTLVVIGGASVVRFAGNAVAFVYGAVKDRAIAAGEVEAVRRLVAGDLREART